MLKLFSALCKKNNILIKYFVEKQEKENIWIFLKMRVSTLTGTDILGVDHRQNERRKWQGIENIFSYP